MKLSVSETAKLTGISVRTLHFYDETGLLKPDFVDEQNGYRYYSESSLRRLQEILFYRELDFSLKDIKNILSDPKYDKNQALKGQKELLLLKKKRIERLIDVLDKTIKEDDTMNFNAFDNSEFEKMKEIYSEEVKEKWGNTDAYKENVQKTASYDKEKWKDISTKGDSIINEFSVLVEEGVDPSDLKAQNLVQKWKDYITENYYNCTDEILFGLGEMYIADERFTKNIDKIKKGTAQFMNSAIKKYCKK